MTDRTPHLSAYGDGCGGTDQAGSEVVFEYTASADLQLEITVTPDSELNPAIRIIETCEENNDCLGSINEGSKAVAETLRYTIESGETIFIVIEQIGETTGGQFDISIKESEIITDEDIIPDEANDETIDEDIEVDSDETSEESPDQDQDDAVTECTGISIGEIEQSSDPEALYNYHAEVTSSLGDESVQDQFMMQFFAETSGTVDLGSGKNTNYETCDQCLLVNEDYTEEGAAKTYFQESGSITITGGTVMEGKCSGTLISAKLVEVTIETGSWKSNPVPNGSCLEIESASWNTMESEPSDDDIIDQDHDKDAIDNNKTDSETKDSEEPENDTDNELTDLDDKDEKSSTSGCGCSMIF